MASLRVGALLIWTAGATGCTTLLAEPRRQAVHEREDFLLLQDDLRRMEGRIEGLELDVERVRAQTDEAGRRHDTEWQRQSSTHREQTAEIDRRMRAIEAARERDRQEIVTQLSRQMAELLQQHRPATPSGRRPAGRQTGYEHEVQPGETLSAIAAAYSVRVRTIQEANDIQDPNRLRVGQVLFIPEP